MSKVRMSAAALAGLWAASVSNQAGAADGAGHTARGGGSHGRVAVHIFERVDENADGKITSDEAVAAGKRLFERLDQNRDGQLTRAESEAGARAFREEQLAARFAELDGDGDGRLTSAEAQVTPQVFLRLDTDKDRALSLQEFSARSDQRSNHHELEFNRADANHDGKVTRDEADQAAAARFANVDVNRDGTITRQEFDAHVAQLAQGKARQR